jgi:CspA family cold shock protein
MPQGTIKKIVTDKGFGFISGEKGDIFFHLSSVQGKRFEELTEGESVEYETEISQKGPRAVSVRAV